MPDFTVRRLPVVESDRRYHMFDDQNQLVLVADYRSPWLQAAGEDHVRLARPDGRLVATLDMTEARPSARRKQHGRSYAIIHDYAVYGILNDLRLNGARRPAYSIEVEGTRWLAFAPDEDRLVYNLYDRVPGQLGKDVPPDPERLPHPVGLLEGAAGSVYALTLPAGFLRQRELVGLSLVFLIDTA